MLLKNKLTKLKSLLNGDNVLTKMEEHYCYANDASNLEKNLKLPDLVVFVETIEDVQKIVKYAYEHEISIIPRGAGTNMVGACLCPRGGIVLNFSKMNKILKFSPADMMAVVQPGVILGDLKTLADRHLLFFPPDPSNYKVSTIGGAIAQSSGGAMSFKYGTIKDYVLSLKIVTAEGKLMTLGCSTTKDAAGYHLAQLMVGSEGTLGIIVEATLKLIPKPEYRKSLIAYANNIEQAINGVNKIITNNIFPATIDFMDNNAMQTVEAFMPTGLKTDKDCLLLIELDGTELSVNSQIEKLLNILKSYNITEFTIPNSEIETEKIWDARRSSFAATTRLAPDVVSDDIIVPRSKLTYIINICKEICNKYNLKLCLVGHIGDGNLHPQVALNLENEEEYKNYQNAKAEIYSEVISCGGSISAEHGIGVAKLPYLLNTIDRTTLEYMKTIKQAFDHKNILNPDKIFLKD